jgi:hypothetical protein
MNGVLRAIMPLPTSKFVAVGECYVMRLSS